MSAFESLGFHAPRLTAADGPVAEHILVRRPLRRVLAFLGRSIDDVCNDPVVKNTVIGYYKLHLYMQRQMEVTDLERQWNGVRA